MKSLTPSMSIHTGICVLLAVASMGLASAAQAQWKWKDSNERVQYSDLPPPSGVPESAILQRPRGGARAAPALPTAPPSASAPAAKSVDPELDAKRKKAEQEAQAKRKADEDKVAATRQDNCNRAKSQMRALDDGLRIARVNAQGEREFLDDKGRAEEAQRTRDVMASECGKN
jgi:hypothetical protein